MGDERFTTQRETSTNRQSRPSSHSTSPHHAAYATERATILFGCYRRGDANDPDIYVRAVAAVLARYDADVIREVTDPNSGIQTTEKYMTFMPNAGELKVYCEAQAVRRDRMRRLAELPAVDFTRARLPPPPPQPGDKVTVFVPDKHPRYLALVEWSKTADPRLWKFGRSSDARVGIWVSWDTWDDRRALARSIGDAASAVTKKISDQPAHEAAE